jgi:flagellin-like protein
LACHDLVKRTANDLALLLLGEEHGRLAWRNPIPALLEFDMPAKTCKPRTKLQRGHVCGARAASHFFFLRNSCPDDGVPVGSSRRGVVEVVTASLLLQMTLLAIN